MIEFSFFLFLFILFSIDSWRMAICAASSVSSSGSVHMDTYKWVLHIHICRLVCLLVPSSTQGFSSPWKLTPFPAHCLFVCLLLFSRAPLREKTKKERKKERNREMKCWGKGIVFWLLVFLRVVDTLQGLLYLTKKGVVALKKNADAAYLYILTFDVAVSSVVYSESEHLSFQVQSYLALPS